MSIFTETEQLFVDLILEIGKDSINESYDDITEEDLIKMSIIMEFFLDNYKIPSLNESAKNILLNKDINEALYITIIDALLNEGYLTNKIASAMVTVSNPLKSRKLSKSIVKQKKYLQKGADTLAKNTSKSNFIAKAYRKGKAASYLSKAMDLNKQSSELHNEIATKKANLQNKLDKSLVGKGINAIETGYNTAVKTGKAIVNAPKNLITKLATATGKVMAF